MNIQEIVAYCGLTCKSCPIYWATREEDKDKQKKMRIRIAQLGSEHYGIDFNPADITDCDGCRAENGRIFSGCSSCEIRACARQNEYITCASCPDYICDKLQKLYDSDPIGRDWLEIVRSVI